MGTERRRIDYVYRKEKNRLIRTRYWKTLLYRERKDFLLEGCD